MRVGNEKTEDEADTVGCCSLRVEHIQFPEENTIKLDFLGKDSMRYENTVKVHPRVYSNLRSFVRKKQPEANIFDAISTSLLNEYLKGMMDGLTAKVFRTYNASSTLQKGKDFSIGLLIILIELHKKDVLKLELDEKVKFYEKANKQVAVLCNHQKTVSKNFDQQLGRLQAKVSILLSYDY